MPSRPNVHWRDRSLHRQVREVPGPICLRLVCRTLNKGGIAGEKPWWRTLVPRTTPTGQPLRSRLAFLNQVPTLPLRQVDRQPLQKEEHEAPVEESGSPGRPTALRAVPVARACVRYEVLYAVLPNDTDS